ncbi:MAG TPA: YfhO family protein [Candidatus Acidoferrales bacterium]|nr:YfhO family protein [Candidatus Acidoferrales bacterium]
MAQKDKRQRLNKASIAQEKSLLPERYETPFFIILILVLLVVFFNKAFFEGKVFVSPDVISPMSFQTYLQEASNEHIFPLWIPYVFSGMPSFASLMIAGTRAYDLTNYLFGEIIRTLSIATGNIDVAWAVLFYFFFGTGVFVLLRRLGIGKFAAFFAATATVFTMNIIIWIMVGHGTKIITISFFPYIFIFIIELSKKFRWSYFIALIIAIHLMLEGSHVQMIYYTLLTLGLYYLYNFVVSLFKKENLRSLTRNAAILIAAGVIAFAMSSDKYMSILEYSKYSIRGSQPIVQTSNEAAQSGAGLSYDYATSWSFSPGELTTFFVPSFYGFGDYTYNGPLSSNQDVRVNTYFGQMPFTVAPEYMGVITIILAIIGFVANRKNRFVQFSLFTIIVTLLLSFGNTFSVLFDLMFYHFPYFNRFRSPSMILVLVQIFIPILAAYGIDSMIKARENADKQFARRIFISGSVFAGLLLLSLTLNGSIKDFYYGIIDSSRKVSQQAYPILFDNMVSDLYVSLLICTATCGIIYLYLTGKLKTVTALGALTLVLLVDLWRVDAKPMEYSDKAGLEQQFTKPDFVSFIQRDTTLYRVIQFHNFQPEYSNTLAYFQLQNAYGYTGAKLRNYQDMMDVAGITNPNVLRLLGVKYVISDKPDSLLGRIVFHGSQFVLQNDNALPRAFFVNNCKVASALTTLQSLRDGTFDPSKTVYLQTDPHIQIDAPGTDARVRFSDYELQSMAMQVNATGNNFLVLSEIYYPKGWEATIDGEPAEIYQSDYFLRGILIPRGNHTVSLVFHPTIYYAGRSVSLVTNIVLVLGLVGTGFTLLLRKRKKTPAEAR